jgi:hypothetical protein
MFCKNIVCKGFTKKSIKTKTDFFSIFLSCFEAFLGEGSSKTPQKISTNESGPFLASDSLTHHGGPRLFFADPLALPLTKALGPLRLRLPHSSQLTAHSSQRVPGVGCRVIARGAKEKKKNRRTYLPTFF